MVVEATAWRFRTGTAWRDLPERFGNWNTMYKNFRRWAADGVWEDLLTHVQKRASLQGEIDWVVSVDSSIARVHQHGATLPRDTGGLRRTTRSTGRNLLTTRSAGHEAV